MSKLILKCTASSDKNPIKISPEDYNKVLTTIDFVVKKYNFEFEGGGFYIDGAIK